MKKKFILALTVFFGQIFAGQEPLPHFTALYKNAFIQYGLMQPTDPYFPVKVITGSSHIFHAFCIFNQPNSSLLEPAITFDPKDFSRPYGWNRFTAHHEIGHFEDALNKSNYNWKKLVNQDRGLKINSIISGCTASLIIPFGFTFFHLKNNPSSSFYETLTKIGLSVALGKAAEKGVKNLMTARASHAFETYADERACQTIECDTCCFQAAQEFGYHQNEAESLKNRKLLFYSYLTYPLYFLKGIGHPPDYLRGHAAQQAGERYAQENKRCDYHRDPTKTGTELKDEYEQYPLLEVSP